MAGPETASASATDPGSDDDYGRLLTRDATPGGAAEPSYVARVISGKVTPEPRFSTVDVGGIDIGGTVDPGTWHAEVTYGPWTGTSPEFTVGP